MSASLLGAISQAVPLVFIALLALAVYYLMYVDGFGGFAR